MDLKVLFYDYAYQTIKVDAGLVDIDDWADQSRGSTSRDKNSSPSSSRRSVASGVKDSDDAAHSEINKVLAIEAFGVSDNEVFARAWCAHSGLSAVVANIKETCMACAIREAYAACVSVVILTEGGRSGEKDEELGPVA
jgi:hypothetical protein